MREIFLYCLYRTCSAFYLLLREESFWRSKAGEGSPVQRCNIYQFYCFSQARGG